MCNDSDSLITFRKELEYLINMYSKENVSNTPDFILADYLQVCLNAFDMTVNARDTWYGVRLEPGRSSFLCTDPEEESAISEESFGTIDGPKY